MSLYDLEVLMTQTRRLAADYRKTTGQSLPVTMELARFDAVTLLGLQESEQNESEAFRKSDQNDEAKPQKLQIKGRVIFPGGKSRQKVGQLNFNHDWDVTVLVIYDPDYQPKAIFQASYQVLKEAAAEDKDKKRGSMTVAKFKAIGEQLWIAEP